MNTYATLRPSPSLSPAQRLATISAYIRNLHAEDEQRPIDTDMLWFDLHNIYDIAVGNNSTGSVDSSVGVPVMAAEPPPTSPLQHIPRARKGGPSDLIASHIETMKPGDTITSVELRERYGLSKSQWAACTRRMRKPGTTLHHALTVARVSHVVTGVGGNAIGSLVATR